MELRQNGFVPQGHARIIPFRVAHAWLHEKTGAWLSVQHIGPAMALVWRSCDSWGATPYLIDEICRTLDADENFRTACELAKHYLSEGPPSEMMASAKRSGEARAQKVKEAARRTRQKKEQ